MRNHRIALLVLLCGCTGAAVAADYVDPPGRVARVSFVDGAVSVAPAGSEEWGAADLNRPLTTGDRIWADAGARTELEIGSATLRLDENTGLTFDNLTDDVLQARLTSGVMTVHVGSLAVGQIAEVATPNTTVTLLQRGDYTIEVAESGDQTIVRTRSGEATVAGASQQAYGVAANEQGVFSGTTNLTADITGIEPRTRFEDWAYAREARDTESITARYVSRDVIGYRDLDTYGTWYNEAEYGYVWRPTLLVDDWAPYRFGRWVWVAPWGWTWIDDAPWGFAPSHYGRWAYVRNRWCWVPGPSHIRAVYAPALVGWVGNPGYGYTDGFGNVGWFPLAPREAYVPCYHTSWRHFHDVNVSNTVIVNNTYINNVYQGRGAPINYRNRHVPHALTVVQHDTFVSARGIGDHRERFNDDELRSWPTHARTPTIAPNRDSMIGTRVNTPRAAPQSDRWAVSNHRPDARTADEPGQRAAFAPRPRPQAPQPQAIETTRPAASAAPPPNEQHVQRQWSGNDRRADDGAALSRQSAPPAPQPQSAPRVTMRPERDADVRQTEPRHSENIQPAPRASVSPAPVEPQRAQSERSGQVSQRAAMGNGRHDRADNTEGPRGPQQNDGIGAGRSPQSTTDPN